MLSKFFFIDNTQTHKILCVCGLKFKFRKKNDLKKINSNKLQDSDSCYMSKQLENKNFIFKFYPCEEIFPKNFYNDFITEDLTEKYINLTRGLDVKSIKLINRILYRIISFAKYKKTDFFVEEEEYKEIIEMLHPDIISPVSLGNGYNAVNGYCLSGTINCGAGVICKHFVNDFLNKNKILNGNIIDAGAYIGDIAIVLSDYTNLKVYAFEPENSNFENLKRSIAINKLEDKIIPVKSGISDVETEMVITIPADNEIGAYIEQKNNMQDLDKKQIVKTICIDKYVSENKIKVGLIKTDVEGFEQFLLKGAYETIKRDKPSLIISTYHNFNDFWNIKPLIEDWNLGYTFKFRKPSTLDFCGDLCLLAEVLE